MSCSCRRGGSNIDAIFGIRIRTRALSDFRSQTSCIQCAPPLKISWQMRLDRRFALFPANARIISEQKAISPTENAVCADSFRSCICATQTTTKGPARAGPSPQTLSAADLRRLLGDVRDLREAVLHGLVAVGRLVADELRDVLRPAHADLGALAQIVDLELIGLGERLRAGELLDRGEGGLRVLGGGLEHLAVDVGDAAHGVDHRAFD